MTSRIPPPPPGIRIPLLDRFLRTFLIAAATVLASAGVSGILAGLWVGGPWWKVIGFECVTWAVFAVCVAALRSGSGATPEPLPGMSRVRWRWAWVARWWR